MDSQTLRNMIRRIGLSATKRNSVATTEWISMDSALRTVQNIGNPSIRNPYGCESSVYSDNDWSVPSTATLRKLYVNVPKSVPEIELADVGVHVVFVPERRVTQPITRAAHGIPLVPEAIPDPRPKRIIRQVAQDYGEIVHSPVLVRTSRL
ncbi:hypothetical protein BGZ93_010989 [Podila epicladia]|nr:hypothetical protein BGZ93_010989 [Podila epicladia]